MTKKPSPLPLLFLEQMAEALKVLGHAQRLRIVEVLDLEGEMNGGDVAEACGGSQSQVSQHLNRMRRLGLVAARREGTQVLYSLAGEHPVTILDCIRRKFAETPGGGRSGRPGPKKR